MHLQQIYKRDTEFNTNEIANGVLACLVAVTGCCPFIDPLWAILIGRKSCDVISEVCISCEQARMCPPVLCSSHHPLLSRWMLYRLPAGHSGWSKDISFAWNMVHVVITHLLTLLVNQMITTPFPPDSGFWGVLCVGFFYEKCLVLEVYGASCFCDNYLESELSKLVYYQAYIFIVCVRVCMRVCMHV